MEDIPPLAELILERIADAVIYADRSGTIMRWNYGATALFGYSATEALGQSLDLIAPSTSGRVIGATLQQPWQMAPSRCRAAQG